MPRSPRVASVMSTPAQAPPSALPHDEYVSGWGVLAQVFDSGHVLALRVFPEGTFGGFVAVWLRDPDGTWSMYVDSPRPETACPRYFGAATSRTCPAHIQVEWTSPSRVCVWVDRPALTWAFTLSTTPALAAVNLLLPFASRRPRALARGGEVVAQALGLGRFPMTMTAPSGHLGTLLPSSMFFVDGAHAVLDGLDLGEPVRAARTPPQIGEVRLPARAVLATGRVVWQRPG